MLKPISRTFLAQLLLCCLALFPAYPQATPQSLLILNAQVADGTGAPLHRANVRIAGNRIVAIGKLAAKPGEATLDAKGLVLAPGFIDIHNHSEESLPKDLAAETQVSQGITTLIIGADGESPWPLASWFHQMQDHPAAVNVGSFAGHATIRLQAMGKDFKRTATPAEVRLMEEGMRQEMNGGALGLSSGLEYEVGSYAATDELVALAKIAAASGGVYMTHIRDEADKSFEALEEEIAIGERAHIPVEHSHIKLGTVGVQGKAPEYIKIIEAARKRGVDFLADCYPYDAWHSNLKVVVPDKQYENPKSVSEALESYGGGSHITITEFSPDKSYAGHTIAELAKSNGLSETDMYIRLIREGDAAHTEASIIGQSMIESDMKAFYQQPWVMVASDGGVNSQHPRGAGTFTRVLGLYVREKHWLTLPEAVRKMTSLPAQRLGWKDRGVLQKGAVADLVLFDPATVIDRSTFADPAALSAGIEKVFVNGVLVWDSGKPTGARPGIVIGRKGAILGVAN
ncbi:MAG TPA: D-aminoacylase [Candidatus Limnocylindrales bacterium]|nr:D-aminoacylase [Candidatus Limnocylindrales bacterium]